MKGTKENEKEDERWKAIRLGRWEALKIEDMKIWRYEDAKLGMSSKKEKKTRRNQNAKNSAIDYQRWNGCLSCLGCGTKSPSPFLDLITSCYNLTIKIHPYKLLFHCPDVQDSPWWVSPGWCWTPVKCAALVFCEELNGVKKISCLIW